MLFQLATSVKPHTLTPDLREVSDALWTLRRWTTAIDQPCHIHSGMWFHFVGPPCSGHATASESQALIAEPLALPESCPCPPPQTCPHIRPLSRHTFSHGTLPSPPHAAKPRQRHTGDDKWVQSRLGNVTAQPARCVANPVPPTLGTPSLPCLIGGESRQDWMAVMGGEQAGGASDSWLVWYVAPGEGVVSVLVGVV